MNACCGGNGSKIAEKMRHIYDSGKLSMVKEGSVLVNHELFEQDDPLYQIKIEDYAVWVLEQLRCHSHHLGVLEQGLTVIQLLTPQHIVPKTLPPKIFQWIISSRRGDLMDVLKYCAVIYAGSDVEKCRLICRTFVENMNFDVKKLIESQQKGKKIFPYLFQKRWEILRIMTQSEKVGGLTCENLTGDEGIKLLTWALKHYQSNPEDSYSISHALYICKEVIASSEENLSRLLKSSPFLEQLKSFLPTRLKAATKTEKIVNGKDLLKAQMGMVMHEYAGLMVDMAGSVEFREKFAQLNFLSSFKSALRIINDASEWSAYKKSLEAMIFTTLFAIFGQMKDVIFTQNCFEELKTELETGKDFEEESSSLHWWCRRCLLQHSFAVQEFLDRLQDSHSKRPEVEAAIQICEQILTESEKEKEKSMSAVNHGKGGNHNVISNSSNHGGLDEHDGSWFNY